MKTSTEFTTAPVSALVAQLKRTADECDAMNVALKQRKEARRAQRLLRRRRIVKTVTTFPAERFTMADPAERLTVAAQKQFVSRVIHTRVANRLGVNELVLHEIRAEELRVRELALQSQGTGSIARMAARQLAREEDLTQARLTDLGMRGGKARSLAQRAIVVTQQQSEFSEERWIERREHAITEHRPRVRL